METLNGDLRKTPKELKIDLIGYQLAQGEVEKAWEIAEKMDDNSIIEKLCYMRKSGSVSNVQESELESYRNIRSLKESTDQKDIFHIYKMNCEEINNEPQFMCSRLLINVWKWPLKWIVEKKLWVQKSSLSEEDSIHRCNAHSRVNGYKTVTMWTFHPGINKVVNLAIMDCHKENTEMLTLFLELFN